mgnify:CR=1 FL=1
MKPPKFLMGDNTQSPDSIFVIHTGNPSFVLDVDSEEVFFLEKGFGEADREETANQISELVSEAMEFYDSEIQAYEELED